MWAFCRGIIYLSWWCCFLEAFIMMPGGGPSLLFITLMSHKYACQAIMKYRRGVIDPQDAFVFRNRLLSLMLTFLESAIWNDFQGDVVAVADCAALTRNWFCVNPKWILSKNRWWRFIFYKEARFTVVRLQRNTIIPSRCHWMGTRCSQQVLVVDHKILWDKDKLLFTL